jgi:hypothetical protein
MDGNKAGYALFTDTYARLLARKGENKKAFELEKEALMIVEEQVPAYLDAYALFAEKELSAQAYQAEMERLVKAGKSTNNIIEKTYILRIRVVKRDLKIILVCLNAVTI